MSIPLTVGSDTFDYPAAGETPGWGESASDWAVAVTQQLASITNSVDVPLTQINIANNVSGAAVAGLVIDPTTVRSATVVYNCYRLASVTGPGYAESGTIDLVYSNLAASNQKWIMSQQSGGYAGISFDVGDDGQFTYTTLNLSATGTLTFKASTVPQTVA